MKKDTYMLSLDTSTTDTGFAIWESGKLYLYGDINLENYNGTNNNSNDKRLDEMIVRIKSKVDDFKIDILVVESLTVFNDIKTDSNLAELIGACRNIAIISNCWFDKLSPNEWRNLVSNENEVIPRKRKEAKVWDIKKVKELFDIELNNDNVADAILIGEAYKRLFK